MNEKFDISERPNIIPWPPIVLAFVIVLALCLGALFPVRSYTKPIIEWLQIPGILLMGMGVILDVWGMATMHYAKTNIIPNTKATNLVTTGPFRFTRNPIYLGNTILLIGIALCFNRPWFLLAAGLHVILDETLAIRREEKHLAARFGKEWEEFKDRVPRWIGWL